MSKLKNARDIFEKHLKKHLGGITLKLRLLSEDTIELDAIKEAQKDAVEVALEIASKNARIKTTEYNNPYSDSDGRVTTVVDKKSILDCKEEIFNQIK